MTCTSGSACSLQLRVDFTSQLVQCSSALLELKWLCFFQGVQAIGFFFFFKSSDDVLKFFAITRFFEIYFIVPHFIGFINGRLDLHFKSASECTSPVAHVLGVERTPTNKRRHSSAFFPTDFDTAK